MNAFSFYRINEACTCRNDAVGVELSAQGMYSKGSNGGEQIDPNSYDVAAPQNRLLYTNPCRRQNMYRLIEMINKICCTIKIIKMKNLAE